MTMKIVRSNNLAINILPNDPNGGTLDEGQLWFVPAAAIVESWISDDGLTWYQKFSNGFVMQGGQTEKFGTGTGKVKTVTLPVPMANTSYFAVLSAAMLTTYAVTFAITTFTTSSFTVNKDASSGSASDAYARWLVCGTAAN
jgi:hypothetical protein